MLQRLLAYLQVDRTFILLVFLFSYFLVISNRVKAGMLSWYTFTPEGPLIQFLAALLIFCVLRFWLNRHKATQQQPLSLADYARILLLALLCYLLFNNGMGFLIAAVFGNISRNFNSAVLLQANLGYMIDLALYAGIYLAYIHSKQAAAYRQQLADYNAELAELKIQQLKAQLNPHFVFNSLNTLDELISVAPARASNYLNDFADLYRLSLHNSQQQVVSLAQELAFARHYFSLMQLRLGEHYQLQIAVDTSDAGALLLPPFTLQLLLENALLHNRASATEPLSINIELQQAKLVVTNPLQAKHATAKGNGIGLANLAKQFLFLTGHTIEVKQSAAQFSVSLPLIPKAVEDTRKQYV
ncbi:sensor histidine kinase [Alishewanella longhuensis]